MSTAIEPTIEQGLAALEAAMAEIRQQSPPVRTPVLLWLEKISGIMTDKAAFEEMTAHGRAYRDADRPSDDEPSRGSSWIPITSASSRMEQESSIRTSSGE